LILRQTNTFPGSARSVCSFVANEEKSPGGLPHACADSICQK
jgi:hypothetical protein